MISEAVRKEVMERDHGHCQFFHRQPVPATEISHQHHQGIGGLPEDHWKNQAGNLAASCGECHRKLHGPGSVYIWSEFRPLETPGVKRAMSIFDPIGKQVPESDLWFYVRHEAERLQKVEARIQGLAMIEGDVARDLYELSKGYTLLEPDAVSFAQYIAGRNVSANRAVEAARAYGWMEERGLAWPVGLTSEKADIIRKAIGPVLLDLSDSGEDGGPEVQTWLDAAVDQSVSDLKQELIDAELMKASVRWYISIRPRTFIEWELLRARDVLKVLRLYPVSMVIRADKFVAGLNWDRKTRTLSDRNGNEIPYKDLA